eukprot:CAMPEP_0118924584 /NCGR_PEP_ID=MMETSP1169-20130426/2655_1 /TAXON_ID=36882 /ORGANISM="Pyramimonas obovata, Strain CCMP722" /LENGTH=187 /DNA_ID=CAMNT_0006865711 /DNA_START=403 /DNA_END=961 /DNA_ORIENTATION=-
MTTVTMVIGAGIGRQVGGEICVANLSIAPHLARRQARLARRQARAEAAEAGWSEFSDTGSCFRVFTEARSWHEAEFQCKIQNGALASVHSSAENEFIRGIRSGNDLWLGGSDRQQEGVWVWTDGSPWTDAFWDDNEPNNGAGRGQHCLVMWRRYGDSSWDDDVCEHAKAYVCKQSPAPPPPPSPSPP